MSGNGPVNPTESDGGGGDNEKTALEPQGL